MVAASVFLIFLVTIVIFQNQRPPRFIFLFLMSILGFWSILSFRRIVILVPMCPIEPLKPLRD